MKLIFQTDNIENTKLIIDNKENPFSINYDLFDNYDTNLITLYFGGRNILRPKKCEEIYNLDYFERFITVLQLSIPISTIKYYKKNKQEYISTIKYDKSILENKGQLELFSKTIRLLDFYNISNLYDETNKQDKTYIKYVLYQCNNDIDIVLACLYELAKKESIIKRCKHCNKLFVCSSNKEKYCNRKSPLYKNSTCSMAEKKEKNKENNKNPYMILHNKIKYRLAKRLQRASANNYELINDEYNNFLRDSTNLRNELEFKIKKIYEKLKNERKDKEFYNDFESNDIWNQRFNKSIQSQKEYINYMNWLEKQDNQTKGGH